MQLNDSRTQAPRSSSSESSSHADTVFPALKKNAIEESLIAKVEPVLRNLGLGLRDLEVLGGVIIRITLESLDGETKIGIENCQEAHRVLGPMFDVWDPLPSAYTLEVSSPGEKPTLRLFSHFQAALGETVKVETIEAIPVPPPAKPRRRWEGVLKSVDATTGDIRIEDDAGEHVLNFRQIRTALWLRDWTMSQPKKPSKKKVEK